MKCIIVNLYKFAIIHRLSITPYHINPGVFFLSSIFCNIFTPKIVIIYFFIFKTNYRPFPIFYFKTHISYSHLLRFIIYLFFLYVM